MVKGNNGHATPHRLTDSHWTRESHKTEHKPNWVSNLKNIGQIIIIAKHVWFLWKFCPEAMEISVNCSFCASTERLKTKD